MSDPGISPVFSSPVGESRTLPYRVDIWNTPLHAEPPLIDQMRATLSPDEVERSARFVSHDHENLFIAGRGILRQILSSYLDVRPQNIVFRYAARGKPYLQSPQNLQFNLAHSGGRALYAISANELGVDVEFIKAWRDWEKISARFFSSRESAELAGFDTARQIAGFFACWTRKEAYIKATGEGMATSLGKFYAGADPAQKEGKIQQDGSRQDWYFKDLELGHQYAGAVVTQFPHSHIHSLNFTTVEETLQATLQSRSEK